ncbi:hypothetical protein F4824DRAFT_476860 [Ustulina deusta]|nr:hypothetical protein F4824DRAFT_476860 [Ustulina deusta]
MRALIILCLTKSRVSRPVIRTFGVLFFFPPNFFLAIVPRQSHCYPPGSRANNSAPAPEYWWPYNNRSDTREPMVCLPSCLLAQATPLP